MHLCLRNCYADFEDEIASKRALTSFGKMPWRAIRQKNHGYITVMVATVVLVGKETLWMIWICDHQIFFFTSSTLIDFFSIVQALHLC